MCHQLAPPPGASVISNLYSPPTTTTTTTTTTTSTCTTTLYDEPMPMPQRHHIDPIAAAISYPTSSLLLPFITLKRYF